jgi:integrase
MMPRLSAIAIENFRPRSVRYTVPDSGCRGLYLNVYPTGRKSWSVRYRFGGITRNLTLDGFPSLAQARMAATKVLAEVAQGRDPAAVKQEARRTDRVRVSDTVEHWASLFVERHAKKHTRPNSWRQTVHVFDDYVLPAWRGRLTHDIKRKDVRALLEGIAEHKPIMANRVHGVLSKFFKWVCARDEELTSPVIGVERPAEERVGERALDDEELCKLWSAAEKIGGREAACIKLLLLTGQRREQISHLKWHEVGNDTLEWSAERMKGKRAHLVPQSVQAAAIIAEMPKLVPQVPKRDDYVWGDSPIGHFHRIKDRLDECMGDTPKWVIRDIRRSVATGMARIGIAVPVIEKILAHRKGTFAGIVSVYQKYSFLPEMAAAMQKWADHIEDLVSGRKAAKVVQLRKTK